MPLQDVESWDGAGPGVSGIQPRLRTAAGANFFFFFLTLVAWGGENMIPSWPLESSGFRGQVE